MYVRCDESSFSPGLTMSKAPTGNFSAGWPGIIKTMHTGFRRGTRIALCQRLGADTEETGRYDLAWKDGVGVPECSVNSMNYQRHSTIFMFMDI